jgi:hypothetical protein
MLSKIIHISICKRKRKTMADMRYVHTNQTFRLLETDFILEKARAFIFISYNKKLL